MRKLTASGALQRFSREWKFRINAYDADFIRRRIARSSVEKDLIEILRAIRDEDLAGIVRQKGGRSAREADADDIAQAAQLLAKRFDKVWRFWTKLRRDLTTRGKKRR